MPSPERWFAAAAAAIGRLRGWRRWVMAAAAGAVSILAMPPFHLWPLLFVTLPTLFWQIEGMAHPHGEVRGKGLDWSGIRQAAAVGWWFGFGFHVTGLYWLREAFMVTGGGLALLWPLGVVGLPAYLALFYGLAAGAASVVPGPPSARIMALALALTATEYLRGHLFTGFPWNVLGTSLTYPLSLMQSVSVLGVYGLTLLAVLVFVAPAAMLASAAQRHRVRLRLGALALGVGPLALLAVFGAIRLSAPPPPFVDGVKVRLVQPSIPQRQKWQPQRQGEFVQRHLMLSKRSPDGNADDNGGITHVIWPEAAMPFLPLERPQVLAAIGQNMQPGTFLLAGILRRERTADGAIKVYNSLFGFDASGQPVAGYDKTHLVPFGEYLPFQATLEAIGLQSLTRQRGGFAVGALPRPVMRVPGLPIFGPLICYEAVFASTIIQTGPRPTALINVTNDGWFGESTGPYQHYHQARLRAVEQGLPLLRVANNGISAAIDPYGRELQRLQLNAVGVIDSRLPEALPPPPYAQFGDFIPFICWLIVFMLTAIRSNYAH